MNELNKTLDKFALSRSHNILNKLAIFLLNKMHFMIQECRDKIKKI